MSAEDIYDIFSECVGGFKQLRVSHTEYPISPTGDKHIEQFIIMRSFPIASNSTREMPKKDRIHPFFQAWVGVSRTQRLRRLRHGAMSQVLSHPTSSDMIDTWSKPNAGPGNNYQSQANHPYFPIFVWLDSTFFSAIYSDLTLVAGRKQLASP